MNDDEGAKRVNINELIQHLLTIIPTEFFDEYYRKNSDPKFKDEPVSKNKGMSANANKPTKGQILTQAVEYVNWLQEQVDIKNREEVELILRAKRLCKETGSIVNDLNLDNTSAELALARIGVGPLAGMFDHGPAKKQGSHPSADQPSAAESGSHSQFTGRSRAESRDQLETGLPLSVNSAQIPPSSSSESPQNLESSYSIPPFQDQLQDQQARTTHAHTRPANFEYGGYSEYNNEP